MLWKGCITEIVSQCKPKHSRTSFIGVFEIHSLVDIVGFKKKNQCKFEYMKE